MNKILPKSSTLLLVFLLFSLFFNYPAAAGQEERSKSFLLENGLRVFLYERHHIPLFNLVIGVNLGSKDETNETNGLVHILEHYILFRGTEHRTGDETVQDIRRHGAYFNAFTGHDLALFEISLPFEFADFALLNQREILFNLKLTQEELDQEKEIILEELKRVRDDPFRYATALVYQSLFRGHPYERPVYGQEEVIKSVTVDRLESFYRKHFVPSNCSLAAVGGFDIDDMEKKIRDIYGAVDGREFVPEKFETAPRLEKNVELEIEMDVNQGYLVIGFVGPDYNHLDQYAVDVLTEIIGRGINPLLNTVLRGRRNLVQTVSMSYNSHKHGGAILVFLTLDPKNAAAARREAVNFLKKARNENFSKRDFPGDEQFYAFDYLESAQNQIKFNIHRSQEKSLTIARSLATHLLLGEESAVRGGYLENIGKITSTDLRSVAANHLSRGAYVAVTIVPQKK